MKSKITNIVLLSLMLSLFSFVTYAEEDREEKLQLRIQELEQRLKSVEEALKTKTDNQDSLSTTEDQREQNEELRRQIGILAEEIEKLRSGEKEVEITSDQASSMGLGPSAAKVYQKKKGVSIAGYGEMLYENFSDRTQSGTEANKTSQLDFLRAILYTGYRFSDRFVLNSEIEFEHASTGKGGEVSVEFAYLEYMANKHLNVRGGLLLIPMGLTNEYHEPVAFLGARRSETESQIIPTTWREGGIGVLGSASMFSYRAYLVNGMSATGYGASGIRGGRQKGAKAKAEDFALVGRVDVNPSPGMIFGGSLYIGGAGQGQIMESGQNYNVRTTIGEVHAQIQMRGLDIRGLYARAKIDDADELNRFLELEGTESVGEILQGGYIQLGYNLLSQHTDTLRLTPYYRFEKINTQSRVPEGFEQNPAQDRRIHTAGIEFRPITNIAIKGEYQWDRNKAGTGINQFNVNLGYNF
jgi:hypothetical protein